MKTVPAVLFLLLASGAPACTVAGGEEEVIDEGEVTLANPDDAGKSDTVFGKSLRYVVRADWTWSEGDEEMTTDSEVLTQTNDMVRVNALRIIFGLPRDEVLRISVNAESFNDLGEISTDMAFLLFAPDAKKTWQPTRCEQNYFESAIVDAQNREIDVVARGAAGDTLRTFTFAECGIPEDTTQVALFPFPSSGWWSLEGYYHLEVEADCGSRLCPAGKYLYPYL